MSQSLSDNNAKLTNQIYDIYVVKKSGIPLFAGCTGTDYCKIHVGNHELVSGFFSAMFSFSRESFDEEILETMVYGNIMLNFWVDDENDLIFAFVHDRASDVTYIRNQLKTAQGLFIRKFGSEIDDFAVDQAKFEIFRDFLRDEGIIGDKLMDTSSMVKEITDAHETSRPRLVSWLRGVFGFNK